MHTFYIPPSHLCDKIATIPEVERHHFRNVLRITAGDTIRIIDGEGSVYLAKVLGPENARLVCHEFHARVPPSFTLFQSLPKNDKMALILQKTTELGVTRVVPMHSEHSLKKPGRKRSERWERVVISAAKQCHRPWLPELVSVQPFARCLEQVKTFSLSIICSAHEKELHIKEIFRGTPRVESLALFVGPEGGFTEAEVAGAVEKGCIPVTLGQSRLRAETAAIAGIAVAAYEYRR